MASTSRLTSGYEVTVDITLDEVNTYGDHLGNGSLTFTKKISAKGLSELGGLLADIEKLGAKPSS
jgi:hypothetical protein